MKKNKTLLSVRNKAIAFLCSFLLLLCLSSLARSASISVSGNHRFGTNVFKNLDLRSGTNLGQGDTSSFMEHRLLIRPDVLIDERFVIKTEVSLLSHNNFNSNVFGQNYMSFGSAFDGGAGNSYGEDTDGDGQIDSFSKRNGIELTRAYLEWSSDYGIFRAGRMPKAWGLGLLYDPGLSAEDEAGTTVDRVSFDAQVGSLILTLGFEKAQEGPKLHNDVDDAETYEGSLRYANSESHLDIGLLYSRNIRSAQSDARLAGFNSSHDVSFFVQKAWGNLSVGAEAASISYEDQSDVFGALAKLRWEPSQWDFGLDFAHAGSNKGRAFLFHPNYRPFLILYRQNLVNFPGEGVRLSAPVGGDLAAPNGGGSVALNSAGLGAFLGKVSLGYGFSQDKYKLIVDGGWAQAVEEGTQNALSLGYELDAHFEHQWYDNFKTTYSAGVLFPGEALGPNAELAWGMQLRGYLEF